MDSPSLKTLIAGVQAGNLASFEQIYKSLVGPVFAFVSHRTTGRDTAKAVTQDVLSEVYRALPGFVYQSDPAFHAFVFTIARRQLAKHYTDGKKRSGEEATDEFQAVEHHDVETARLVAEALAILDEETREIVVLHHWSRFTFGEIAGLLGLTEEAVRVRHHRAKATLKNFITR